MKMLGSPDSSEVEEEDETVGKIKLRLMDQSSLTHTVFVWNKTLYLLADSELRSFIDPSFPSLLYTM